MVVKIDMSFIPANLKRTLMKSFDENGILEGQRDYDKNLIVFNKGYSRQKVKEFLEQELKKNEVYDYLVSENSEDEREIAILRKGDIEQLGIYPCIHCGMVFGSEEHRTIHERVHYF
jgi:hypothetical protein